MNKIHWKPFIRVSYDGYPMWGTRLVLCTLVGTVVGIAFGLMILAEEL